MMTASPFDVMAETYDQDFTGSAIGRLQRARVWKLLLPVISQYQRPLSILELNCGTGEDAVKLATMGHHVWATDASGAMIAKAQQKAIGVNAKNLSFSTCSFCDIENQFAGHQFDLVFSNFGGLNCIDATALETLSETLSSVTKTNATLAFVVMGRWCIWEMAYYSLKLQFGKAFRRLKRSVSFSSGGHHMSIYYYHPSSMKKIFGKDFTSEQVNPVGLALPPSYLESFFAKRPLLLKKLNNFEEKWGDMAWTSRLADHYCISFKKQAR